jgi:hypothetical protein
MIRSIGALTLASTLAIALAVPASAHHEHDRDGHGGRGYQDRGGYRGGYNESGEP